MCYFRISLQYTHTQRGRSRAGSFNTDLANLGARVVPGPGVKFREVARKLKM